jgi:hypothetical protein
MMKTVFALICCVLAARQRRESEFRLQHGQFIPKSIRTFSPFRDNVVTMVALKLKQDGLKGKPMRNALENVFTHGCHCSWNKGRHDLTDKSIPGRDGMDSACLNFEHCAECLKIDGCDIEAEFSPEIITEGFSCDHLQDDPCKYNACLCSKRLAEDLHAKLGETTYEDLAFTQFMDECAHETDARINTQMSEVADLSRSESTSERQCCGSYPTRRAFTHKPVVGMACCNNNVLYNQKSQHCCAQGVQPIGSLCWDT